MERTQFLVSTHLFLVKENKILLYLRKWWSQDWMYNLIAGHLDWWEDPRQATIREAFEEAWIKIKKEDLHFCNVSHSLSSSWKEYIQFYFSCDKWEGEITNIEQDRCYNMEFFPIENLPNNVTPYIKNAISNFINKVNYDECND